MHALDDCTSARRQQQVRSKDAAADPVAATDAKADVRKEILPAGGFEHVV